MGTSLTYNGITFDRILTSTISQEPIYSEDNTDYLYDKITIKVHGYLHNPWEPTANTETPAETYNRIKACLSKPRQALEYADGSTSIVDSPIISDGPDAKNGPFPQVLGIVKLTSETYHVEYSITTYVYQCCPDKQTSALISHRWTDSVVIDEKFFTHYTRKGRMIFRADLLPEQGADFFRTEAIGTCSLKPGFIRKSESFTLQSDGLAIDYEIQDEEQYAMPLPGLNSYKAYFTQTTEKGAKVGQNITVQVWGNRESSKGDLWLAAIQIASARMLNRNLFAYGNDRFLLSAGMKEHLHEPYLELTMNVQITANIVSNFGVQLDSKINYNLTGGGTDTDIPDPGAFGTAKLQLAAALLKDPCLESFLTTDQTSSTTNPPTPTNLQITTPVITTVPILPSSPTYYNQSQLTNGNYVDVLIKTEYEADLKILPLPTASSTIKTTDYAYLANPTTIKKVKFYLEKSGEQPTLPEPSSSDPNEVLIDFTLTPSNLDVESDGITYNWRVAGEYTYMIIDPSQVKYNAGIAPYLTTPYAASELTTFSTGLTSPPGQSQLITGNVFVP